MPIARSIASETDDIPVPEHIRADDPPRGVFRFPGIFGTETIFSDNALQRTLAFHRNLQVLDRREPVDLAFDDMYGGRILDRGGLEAGQCLFGLADRFLPARVRARSGFPNHPGARRQAGFHGFSRVSFLFERWRAALFQVILSRDWHKHLVRFLVGPGGRRGLVCRRRCFHVG